MVLRDELSRKKTECHATNWAEDIDTIKKLLVNKATIFSFAVEIIKLTNRSIIFNVVRVLSKRQ